MSRENSNIKRGLDLSLDRTRHCFARLEYHPSHRGWHCHVKKGLVQEIGCGVVRHPQSREKVKICRPLEENFDVTELTAFGIARRVFRIAEGGADVGGLFE
jgi:hypothetical protein